jgi:hypothetical protein
MSGKNRGHRDKFQDRHHAHSKQYQNSQPPKHDIENKTIKLFRNNLQHCLEYSHFEKYFTDIVEDDNHRESEKFIFKLLKMDIVSKDEVDLDSSEIFEPEPITIYAKSQEHAFLKYNKILNDKYNSKYDVIGLFADLTSTNYQEDEMDDKKLFKEYKAFYKALDKESKEDAHIGSFYTVNYFATEKLIDEWINLCLHEDASDVEYMSGSEDN